MTDICSFDNLNGSVHHSQENWAMSVDVNPESKRCSLFFLTFPNMTTHSRRSCFSFKFTPGLKPFVRCLFVKFAQHSQINEHCRGNDYSKCLSAFARGKMCANKSRLVLVLLLVGRESGASFANQSQREGKKNQSKRELLSTLIRASTHLIAVVF